MKHQTMLIKSTEGFYLCGGSSIKYFNNEIDKLQCPNINLYINISYFKVVTRCLRLCNKFATRKKTLQIHGISNLVATLYQTGFLQPEISMWGYMQFVHTFMSYRNIDMQWVCSRQSIISTQLSSHVITTYRLADRQKR